MIKKLSCVFLSCFLLPAVCFSNDESFRVIEQNIFTVGERLNFSIDYGFINAGEATMSIPETVTYKGRSCYHITSIAASNKFFTKFFRVRDTVESWMDVKGLFSWKFRKHLEEGKYRSERWVEYDQINNRAITPKDTSDIPQYVQDVLSVLYYIRTLKLEVGTSIHVDNHADGKLYPLEVKIYKREKIKVPAGTFNCIKVEPLLKGAGVFKHKGRLRVWLTDDDKKMPVLMKSKVFIGSISARLKEFKLH